MIARVSEKQARDILRCTLHEPKPKPKPKAKRKSQALPVSDLEETAQQAFVKWADDAIVAPCRYWFVPNGLGKLGRFMAGWAKKMGLKPGVSDIHVMWPGGFGVIEFKSRTGSLSGYQEAFLEDAAACGHRTGVARSKDDAVAMLRAWGCPIRETERRAA